MTVSPWKQATFFAGFFLLFYIEPLSVGAASIAVLWKTLLLLMVVLVLLGSRSGRVMPLLTLWGSLFAAEGLFNESLFSYPVETISFAVKQAYIPILYGFWIWYYRADRAGSARAYALLLRLSLFIVLSTLPFHLGLLEPISVGYDLSIFGVDGAGFVGVFQNSPIASLTLGTATLVLTYHLAKVQGLIAQLLYIATILTGIASIGLTLSRTGFAMFLIGLYVMLFMSRKRIHVIFGGLTVVTVAVVGVYLFQTSDLFRMRILGINSYTLDTMDSVESLGSGRTAFWFGALNYFSRASFGEQIFGFGPGGGMDRMFDEVGLRIYAHNAFVDALQFGGLLGALFFCLMLAQMCGVVFAKATPRDLRPLSYGIFATYVVQNAFQGERAFLADFLFTLCLATVRLSWAERRANLPSTFEVNEIQGINQKLELDRRSGIAQ